MLKSKDVKKYAKGCGADLVGIGSMDRWEGAPKQMDPRYIFPEAKAMIALGFRLPRGYFRGIEEGTYFANYALLGYAGLNIIYIPIVMRQICCFLEDNGYEGVPIIDEAPAIDMWYGKPKKGWWSRPVSPEKPAPDVFVHSRIAAFICGLGEIGYSKLLLTPEFGPRQRVFTILTDAPLEPDPIYEGPPICDRCMLCAKECSGKAISTTETEKVEVAGRILEWGKLDLLKCSIAYGGGVKATSPFLPPDTDESEYSTLPYGGEILREKLSLTSVAMIETRAPIEGAKGCIRACMIHLEKDGKIKNVFKNPFRKRKPWKLA